MCGIAGYYGLDDQNLLSVFSQAMLHRGPDGEGKYTNKNIGLLNRRLAIIDPKGGDQPIYNEDKSVVVVYNGEIYNYLELREELEKFGHTFKTNSDTEVIVHGYEQWGDKCFDKFNGMFGIALYDEKRERLVLARDHFGIKPLYFTFNYKNQPVKFSSQVNSPQVNLRGSDIHFRENLTELNFLLFASEIKPLLKSKLIKALPNDRVIYRYLKYRVHDDSEETFFEGIYKLLPGQMAVIEKNKISFKQFSNLQEELLTSKTKEKSVAEFRQELITAIKYRLIADVPVGTCLSGGLDSSTVVAVVNQLLKKQSQKTFSAVFPGSNNDEEKYVDAVIKKTKNIEIHKVFPKSEDFIKDLEDFVRTQEEPTISSGPYAQYQVMRKAHNYVKVLLDGQGADEMLAGYLPYYFVYLNQLKKEGKYRILIKEIYAVKDILIKYFWLKLLGQLRINKTILPENVLNPNFTKKYQAEKFKTTQDNLKTRLVEDVFKNSIPSLLRYEDKNAMRFSIEGRVPFLDFNLARTIFSQPESAIIENGWNKNILRKAVADLLPEIIVQRRNKIGFTTPEREWFLTLKNRFYGIFMSESFKNRKYFNQEEVIKALQLFIERKNDDSMLFWRMLNLELWLREFIDLPVDPIRRIGGHATSQVGQANAGKKVEIEVSGKKYWRYPIRTELVKKGDDINQFISKYLVQSINRLDNKRKFFVVISEKIVAISQGRSYFLWEIKPSFFATTLSKFVKKTPYGIGLGSPWTMQLAINEAGLAKILFASLASIVTKPFGGKGTFYKIAGKEIAAIDGPTEYSVYPANVSAKLAPKDPQLVCDSIKKTVLKSLDKKNTTNFLGAVIIDANDLGRNVMGNSTELDNALVEKIFQDNPMGQSDEQTPMTVVFV